MWSEERWTTGRLLETLRNTNLHLKTVSMSKAAIVLLCTAKRNFANIEINVQWESWSTMHPAGKDECFHRLRVPSSCRWPSSIDNCRDVLVDKLPFLLYGLCSYATYCIVSVGVRYKTSALMMVLMGPVEPTCKLGARYSTVKEWGSISEA